MPPAVAEGVDGAEQMLISFGDMVNRFLPRLPYLIVPGDRERAKLARSAIVNEYHIDSTDAADLASRLFGFDSWEMMEETVASGCQGASDFDED